MTEATRLVGGVDNCRCEQWRLPARVRVAVSNIDDSPCSDAIADGVATYLERRGLELRVMFHCPDCGHVFVTGSSHDKTHSLAGE